MVNYSPSQKVMMVQPTNSSVKLKNIQEMPMFQYSQPQALKQTMFNPMGQDPSGIGMAVMSMNDGSSQG